MASYKSSFSIMRITAKPFLCSWLEEICDSTRFLIDASLKMTPSAAGDGTAQRLNRVKGKLTVELHWSLPKKFLALFGRVEKGVYWCVYQLNVWFVVWVTLFWFLPRIVYHTPTTLPTRKVFCVVSGCHGTEKFFGSVWLGSCPVSVLNPQIQFRISCTFL